MKSTLLRDKAKTNQTEKPPIPNQPINQTSPFPPSLQVSLGGNTAFPRLGLAIPPERGAAVFWYNIKRSGRTDMAMLHGGCPVLLGSKWVANKWVREFANIYTRKCAEDIDQ